MAADWLSNNSDANSADIKVVAGKVQRDGNLVRVHDPPSDGVDLLVRNSAVSGWKGVLPKRSRTPVQSGEKNRRAG